MNNEKLLKEYNCWRRGDSGYEMPDPTEIGIAIDSVIAQLAALKEESERLRKNVAKLVEALEQGFPLLSDEGLDEVEHHCEWVIQRERKRVHSILAAYRKGGDV